MYKGHLKISKANDIELKNMIGPEKDRIYVKRVFELFFPDSHIADMCSKGLDKKTTLKTIQACDNYVTMKGKFHCIKHFILSL